MKRISYVLIPMAGFAFFFILQEARFGRLSIPQIVQNHKKKEGFAMRQYGMKWYVFIKIWLILCILGNLCYPISSTSFYADKMGITIFNYISIAPVYMYTYLIGSFLIAVIYSVLFFNIRNKTRMICPLIIFLVVYELFYAVIITMLAYKITGTINAEFTGSATGFIIIWIPTYAYMAKRFPPASAEAVHSTSPTPQPTQPSAASEPHLQDASSKPQQMASMLEIIPQRLMGVTDQKQRDNLIAMTFCGQLNPYTGRSMTSEAEWDCYVQQYYMDRDRQHFRAIKESYPAEQEKPVKETEAETEIKQDIETQSDENSQIKEDTPKFCRICGKPLRDDSEFCEFCGKSIK